MEPTPISRIQTASPSSVPSETAGEDGENMGPTEGRHISKLQILNEMHLKIKNGEEGVTPQESLELFEGYLVNLNQSYKTNTSASNKAQGQQPSAAELSTKISIASPNSIPPQDSGYKVELDDLRGGFRQSDFSVNDLKEAWNLYSQIPAERIRVFLDVVEEGKFKTWIEDLESTGLT